MGKIIWTRPLKDWAKDRLLLGDHDFIVPIPATIQQPTDLPTVIPRDSVCILTSTKTVDFMLARHPDMVQSLKNSKKIVCFGAKTAATVEAAGFEVYLEAGSASLEELCHEVARKHTQELVVYIGAKESAFDIDSFFRKEKVNFLHISLYETLALELTQPLNELLRKNEDLLLCVASPSATRSVLSSLASSDLKNSRIEFLCMGKTTAEPLQKTTFTYKYVPEPSIECMANTALKWYNGLSKRGR